MGMHDIARKLNDAKIIIFENFLVYYIFVDTTNWIWIF